MSALLAYHGEKMLKDATVARMKAHRLADELVKGKYWQDGKGCAIGCLNHSGRHDEQAFGLPEWFQWLIDHLFEGLPDDQAKLFPERLLEAIPTGCDLDLVKAPFLSWLMLDQEHGMVRFCINGSGESHIVQRVGDLWRDGGTAKEFEAAWCSARTVVWVIWWSPLKGAASRAAAAAGAAAAVGAIIGANHAAARASWAIENVITKAGAAAAAAATTETVEEARYAQYTAMAERLIELVRGCTP